MAYAPADTARFSWTDWAARPLASSTPTSTPARRPRTSRQFLTDGFDADLTSGSAMVESAAVLQQAFGFSPADVDWELLGPERHRLGARSSACPTASTSTTLGDSFEALGYERPDDDDGVWSGGEELVARIAARDGSTSPRSSSTSPSTPTGTCCWPATAAPYLREAVGDARTTTSTTRASRDVAAAVGEPLSAAVYTGDFACKSLAMAQADEDDQSTADQLVAAGRRRRPADRLRDGRRAGRRGAGRDGLRERRPGPPQRRQPRRAGRRPGARPGRRLRRPVRRSAGRPPTAAWSRWSSTPVDDSPVLSDLSTGPVLFATC